MTGPEHFRRAEELAEEAHKLLGQRRPGHCRVWAAVAQTHGAGYRQRAAAVPQDPATRASGVWIAVACFAVILLLLLSFILQNSRTVDVSYFGAHGHLALGIALLLSAVCGVILTVLPGTARIIQLRITARRHRRADASLRRRGAAGR